MKLKTLTLLFAFLILAIIILADRNQIGFLHLLHSIAVQKLRQPRRFCIMLSLRAQRSNLPSGEETASSLRSSQ